MQPDRHSPIRPKEQIMKKLSQQFLDLSQHTAVAENRKAFTAQIK